MNDPQAINPPESPSPRRPSALLNLVLLGAIALTATTPLIANYVRNLPKNLSREEAGKRYLAIICPSNAQIEDLNQLFTDYNSAKLESKRLTSQRFTIGPELDRAQARVNELDQQMTDLGTRIRERAKTLHSTFLTDAKELRNPKFIWPSEVRQDILTMATETEATARVYLALSQGRDGGKTPDRQVTSRIRQKLGLGDRNTGCTPPPTADNP